MGLIFRNKRNHRNSSDNTITINQQQDQHLTILMDIKGDIGEIKSNTSLLTYRVDNLEKEVKRIDKKLNKKEK